MSWAAIASGPELRCRSNPPAHDWYAALQPSFGPSFARVRECSCSRVLEEMLTDIVAFDAPTCRARPRKTSSPEPGDAGRHVRKGVWTTRRLLPAHDPRQTNDHTPGKD